MIHQLNMNGKDKVQVAIERLKLLEPPEGYYLAFSGGKDSVVIKALADMAGVKYDAHYTLTSVDPPELVRFVKTFPDVIIERPKDKDGKQITMWNLIARKAMPPTSLVRYCCYYIKESGGDGRMTITGVRWAESVRRKQNQGEVTIMNPDKETKEQMLTMQGFKDTKKGGGGFKQRQCRKPKNGRAMLQAFKNDRKPDYRLGGRRRLGIYTRIQYSVL